MTDLLRFIEASSPASLATRLADDIAAWLAEGIEARGAASLVVPGGSTPGLLFDALSTRALAWDKVTVTLDDERWVDPGDPASNERLVRARLITGRAAAARFVGLKTADESAADAVVDVERRLAAIAQPFDVVLLGMGEDGHTASLFPGSAALKASLAGDPARVQAAQAPGARGAAERMTLALSALLDSRAVALLITGQAKLDTLRRAEEPGDPLDLPVRAILQGAAAPVQVYWCA